MVYKDMKNLIMSFVYISDISIEEYRYYINLYKNNDNNSIYRIT